MTEDLKPCPTVAQMREMARQLRDENDFGLRYKPLLADWLDSFIALIESRQPVPSPRSDHGAGGGEGERVAQLLSASPDDHWQKITKEITAACGQVRYAWLLNHEAALLLAWANLARNAALSKAEGRS